MPPRSLPLELDIVVYTGTTVRREFRWLPNGKVGQDFTGWTARLLMGPPRGMALAVLTTENGSITLTSTGQIVISAAPSATAQLKPGVLAYHLDLTDPKGYVVRFLRGRVSVVTDVLSPKTP